MKTIGNIIWFLLIGIGSALGWWLMGLILCITIIGIPFGTQCFKIGTACLTPVGKIMDTNFDAHPIANIFWLIFFGWEAALSYLVLGVIFCITIVSSIVFTYVAVFRVSSPTVIPIGIFKSIIFLRLIGEVL